MNTTYHPRLGCLYEKRGLMRIWMNIRIRAVAHEAKYYAGLTKKCIAIKVAGISKWFG